MTNATGAFASHADEHEFAALARLQRGLLSLQQFTSTASREHGCTAAMYQLLLAVKTSRRGAGVDIGMLASWLGVRHPSAQEMVRKAESAGFLKTLGDPDDGRRVLVELTPEGEETLDAVAHAHAAELRRLRPSFVQALESLGR